MSPGPFIVPVFIPQSGCPHRCIFCRQSVITGEKQASISLSRIASRIEEFLGYRTATRTSLEIAFYGGNFLGLDPTTVHDLLSLAHAYLENNGAIRFSTRPDTITPDTLAWLKGFPISTVELGAQSMNDAVLALSNRGHTARDTVNAVHLLKQDGFSVGLQFMTGLPGEDESSSLETGERILSLAPDCVRIYPTVVLSGTRLADMFNSGTYVPPSLETTVRLVKTLYKRFVESGIPVIRMGLQASGDLRPGETILEGPYHPAFGHLVRSALSLDRIETNIRNMDPVPEHLIITVNPSSVSLAGGLKNRNLQTLKETFGFRSVRIHQDSDLEPDSIVVSAGKQK